MIYFGLMALAITLGVGLAGLGCGIGMGTVVYGTLQGMARQPEMSGKLQTTMFIGLAIIESLTIYALVLAFMLFARLPETEQMLSLIK